ncbi:hypothetical protein LCGC14_3018070, partial [marine sediment metagenome]
MCGALLGVSTQAHRFTRCAWVEHVLSVLAGRPLPLAQPIARRCRRILVTRGPQFVQPAPDVHPERRPRR